MVAQLEEQVRLFRDELSRYEVLPPSVLLTSLMSRERVCVVVSLRKERKDRERRQTRSRQTRSREETERGDKRDREKRQREETEKRQDEIDRRDSNRN